MQGTDLKNKVRMLQIERILTLDKLFFGKNYKVLNHKMLLTIITGAALV